MCGHVWLRTQCFYHLYIPYTKRVGLLVSSRVASYYANRVLSLKLDYTDLHNLPLANHTGHCLLHVVITCALIMPSWNNHYKKSSYNHLTSHLLSAITLRCSFWPTIFGPSSTEQQILPQNPAISQRLSPLGKYESF